jgi:N-acetylglucosamine-6-phosphate deacetylase
MINNGQLEIQGNKITYAGPEKPTTGKVIEFSEELICPGFIDLHIHGAMGFDFMAPTAEALESISRYLAEGGVTGFLATTYTSSRSQTLEAVKKLAKSPPLPGARLLGIHLEGPYINRDKKGAQSVEYVRKPDLKEVKELIDAGRGLIKIVTLAPEKEDIHELIEYLIRQGIVVSAGHTNATFMEAKEAIDKGLSHASHLFNGMRGFHHREPGIVGAALTDGRVSVELIADGLHLHPCALRLAGHIKGPSRTVLISDSIKPAGLKEGEYKVGDSTVLLKNNELRLPEGSLAGSNIRLNQALKTMVEDAGFSLTETVQMVTETPSRILSLSSKGRLEKGWDADITIMDWNFKVKETWIDGVRVTSV